MLDLKATADRDRLLDLADGADVLVENLRPGGLEKLGLGPDVLLARNPRLVITRVTGFGQDGPYSHRPGFATLAEAMSGFAALNGEADGAADAAADRASPTRSPPSPPPSPRWSRCTAASGRSSTSTCSSRCSS